MKDFRRQFLIEAVETLREILGNLRTAKEFSEPLKRETLRVLHTIKGTAQTFDFDVASRLAHELENFAVESSDEPLLEGIELLIESLSDENFQIPAQFAEKIQFATTRSNESSFFDDVFPKEIPRDIVLQLSAQEKTRLRAAIRENKNIFGLEIAFDLEKFAEELIKIREFLNRTSEIIATFPASKNTVPNGKIGFQMLVVSNEIFPPIEDFGANFTFQKLAAETNGAGGILEDIARYGKRLAVKLGKSVEIKIRADENNLSTENSKIVFDALVHLVRNAVDHAIAKEGTIEINLSNEKNGIRLIVADNGNGFDLEKIKAKAVEKNLLNDAAHSSEKDLINLIFLPEFSTKTNLTEISGRGIGLDAVKSSIKKIGGNINAVNRDDKGAMFEIFLPR